MTSSPRRQPRVKVVAFIVFLLVAVASASLIWRLEQYQLEKVRADASNIAADHAHTLQSNIERALSATYSLAALVRQGNGEMREFDAVARQMLPLYPGVGALGLAPRGVVQSIVPLAGNEGAIGHDMLNDPVRGKEAVLARDTGRLTLAGPYNMVQGGMGAVGRLPVFLDDTKDKPNFWGFTTVLIHFPDALETARVNELVTQGFAYELWRIDPGSGQKLIIAASSSAALIEPVVEILNVPNATWNLSVAPINGWNGSLRLSFQALLGLLFSLLLSYLAKLLVELRDQKQGLEARVAQRTAAVQASEIRYRALAQSAKDAIITADSAGNIVSWNQSAESIFGYTEAEVNGQPLTLLIPQRFQGMHLDGMKRVLSGGERRVIGKTIELMGRRKDTTEIQLELSLAEWTVAEGQFFTGFIRDIAERKAAQAKIRRLTQLYAALSQCNEAIVRSANEEELFPKICRAAVQFGGMKTARVSVVDPDTRMVRVVASFGYGNEDLQDLEVSIDADSTFGRGPTGTAIRENQPIWCQDFRDDPLTEPWHERGARLGWGSVAALPLRRNGVAIGAFILFDGEANAFDESKRELLQEMATDISFALDNFSREAARRQAVNELRAAGEQFRGLVEQSIAGIYIIQDEKLAYVNQRYAEIFGYASAEELIGHERLFMVAQRDRAAVAERIRKLLESELSASYDFSAVRKDGATIEIGAHATRATYLGRPAIVGMMQDISEKRRAEQQIQRYVEKLKTAFMSSVEVATTLSEMRDPYTAGHERRVAEIAVAIGTELGLDEQRIEGLRVAGYLHDVGKINIPAEILSKPGKLNPIEFSLIQGHALASYDVLKRVEFPWPVAQIALQHHERMDGSGYPQSLKGESILLEARIIAVADVVEAMSSHRPYRPSLGIDKALTEIERGRASAYDAGVVDACLRLFRKKHYALPA